MSTKEYIKSTDTEILKRIAVVAEMDLKGDSKEKIVRYASENWKISERQTETYLKRARESFIKEACAKNIDEHLGKVVMQHNDLYQKCYSIQDYAECRRILKDMIDLLGLAAPSKIDHTTKGEKVNTEPVWIIQDNSTKDE